LNLRGEVIGINTAVAQGAQNIGFTIPINKATRDIESVKKSGRILLPYLGVRYISLNADEAKKQNVTSEKGALVRGGEDGPAVLPGSPAEKASVKAEDIILKVNGESVDELHSLSSLIQKYNVGDTIRLEVLRGKTTLTLSALLEERK
jgi:serine protease Do